MGNVQEQLSSYSIMSFIIDIIKKHNCRLYSMKIIISFTILLALIATSCKKESVQPPNNDPQPTNYSTPSTVGSYWVYRSYIVDSVGNVTMSNVTDTMFVTGDSIVGGHTYTVYEGALVPNATYRLLRDSSGFVINENGYIYFSNNNLGSIFDTWNEPVYPGPNGPINLKTQIYIEPSLESISVPAGNFMGYVRKDVSTDEAGGPVNVCGDLEYIRKTHYVEGVGMVREEFTFFTAMTQMCEYQYRELVAYYIAP